MGTNSRLFEGVSRKHTIGKTLHRLHTLHIFSPFSGPKVNQVRQMGGESLYSERTMKEPNAILLAISKIDKGTEVTFNYNRDLPSAP